MRPSDFREARPQGVSPSGVDLPFNGELAVEVICENRSLSQEPDGEGKDSGRCSTDSIIEFNC